MLIICLREQDGPVDAETLHKELLEYHQTHLLCLLNEAVNPLVDLNEARQNQDRNAEQQAQGQANQNEELIIDLGALFEENQNEWEESEEEVRLMICQCHLNGFLGGNRE